VLRPDVLRQLRTDLLSRVHAQLTMTLRAGELARSAGVNRETLRYYEGRGLLPRPERSSGGHRLYPPEAVTRLQVIKAAQRLGFTLDEVADLLRLGRSRGSSASLQVRAREKLGEIESRIADLTTIRDALSVTVTMGCDDLHECATQDCCAIPFVELSAVGIGVGR
jgi:DNA-binding transcriptional MerR regulator